MSCAATDAVLESADIAFGARDGGVEPDASRIGGHRGVYYSKRAMLLDEPLRTRTLADLAVYGSRASAQDIEAARRYAELRALLCDLHERLATLPAVSAGASSLDHVIAMSWLVRAMEYDVLSAVDRANDATARAQLRVDSESAHRALVDGPDGAWLRELATAHPPARGA